MSCYLRKVASLEPKRMEIPKELESALRRADQFINLAVSTVHQALTGDGLLPVSGPRSGLILGTAFGPMQTNFDVLELVVNDQQSSPTLFSHSVFNAAVGYLARTFQLSGMCVTLTDFAWPFFLALEQARQALISGSLDRCLVLQVETYSSLLDDIRKECASDYQAPWQPGCIFWLLERERQSPDEFHLEQLKVQTLSLAGEEYLSRRDQMVINGLENVFIDPMAPALHLNELLQNSNCPSRLDCRLSGAYGEVSLCLVQNPHNSISR